MRAAFVGVDVAFAKGKRLPIVISTREEGRIVPLPLRRSSLEPPRGAGNAATLNDQAVQDFATHAVDYIRAVCREFGVTPVRIAIDAPSAPASSESPRRASERALRAARISCFTTPTPEGFIRIRRLVQMHLAGGGAEPRIPHSNQLWMIAGFALFETLRHVAECIEVYPQATVRALGAGGMHKFKEGAVAAQLAAAAAHTGWPTARADDPAFEEAGYGAAHDRLDAYLASWVASLDEPQRTAFGAPPADAIWVPRLQSVGQFANELPPAVIAVGPPPRQRSRVRSQREPTAHSFRCPACAQHEFVRWPWGWDSHAAHSCAGLTATDPMERKHEYRRRFAAHFAR